LLPTSNGATSIWMTRGGFVIDGNVQWQVVVESVRDPT
jgi:hypothetical protein